MVTAVLAASGGGAVFDTASISFKEGYVYVIAAYFTRNDGTFPGAADVSGAGLAWTAHTTQTTATDSGNLRERFALFSTGPVAAATSGVLTFASSGALTVHYTVVEARASSVRQAVYTTPAFGTSITNTLAALLDAQSMVIATGTHSGAQADTIEAGATELASVVASSHTLTTWSEVNDTTQVYTVPVNDVLMGGSFEVTAVSAVSFSGGIAPTGGLSRLVSKGLAGAITPTGALDLLIQKTIELAGSIAPVGTLAKSVTKALAGSITPTGTLALSLVKRFLSPLAEGTLNLIQSVTDTLHLTSRAEDTLHLDPLEEDDR